MFLDLKKNKITEFKIAWSNLLKPLCSWGNKYNKGKHPLISGDCARENSLLMSRTVSFCEVHPSLGVTCPEAHCQNKSEKGFCCWYSCQTTYCQNPVPRNHLGSSSLVTCRHLLSAFGCPALSWEQGGCAEFLFVSWVKDSGCREWAKYHGFPVFLWLRKLWTLFMYLQRKRVVLEKRILTKSLMCSELPDMERERDISFIKSSITTTWVIY